MRDSRSRHQTEVGEKSSSPGSACLWSLFWKTVIPLVSILPCFYKSWKRLGTCWCLCYRKLARAPVHIIVLPRSLCPFQMTAEHFQMLFRSLFSYWAWQNSFRQNLVLRHKTYRGRNERRQELSHQHCYKLPLTRCWNESSWKGHDYRDVSYEATPRTSYSDQPRSRCFIKWICHLSLWVVQNPSTSHILTADKHFKLSPGEHVWHLSHIFLLSDIFKTLTLMRSFKDSWQWLSLSVDPQRESPASFRK